STPYYLQVDGNLAGTTTLQSGANGAVQFNLNAGQGHIVLLATRHGSLSLSAQTCVPPIGTFDAVTSTCSLTADVPDGDLVVSQSGLKVDCRDPSTQVRHSIGSASATASTGIAVADQQDVEVRNCEIINTDFGLSLFNAPRFSATGVRL